ncbi:hypothetical protein [Schlesneria paludicola]|uniref:hypothetical protein n=1 Tax=Schlesneria paludicola TaxID=360056 RepID=UPI00029AD286|nr:hypothetical protein [Schlesneria paludicola]
MPSLARHLAIFAVGIAAVSGCGKNQFQVSKVKGTVTCNGKPLSEGLVVYIPAGAAAATSESKSAVTGRSASGMIQPDGTYELTTYKTGDGAIVGSHSVQVFAPAPVDDDAPLTDANRFACGNTPLEKSVEAKPNVIDLELSMVVAPKGRKR